MFSKGERVKIRPNLPGSSAGWYVNNEHVIFGISTANRDSEYPICVSMSNGGQVWFAEHELISLDNDKDNLNLPEWF